MPRRIRSDVVLVGALTALGLALRIPALRQGIWGDELLAYRDTAHDFGGLLTALRSGPDESATVYFGPENSPPLFFVLAWASRRLGTDPALIRLPSLVLGTATIPLVAWLGLRTVGRWAGVAGAAFVALAPPAVYYSAEGRPYATLMFATVVSVLLLLTALERETTPWWVAYGLSLAAVVYTHYTGVFVVAAQVGWALWRTRSSPRGVLIASACAALAFAPWLPYVKGDALDVYRDVARFLGLTRLDSVVTWLTGLPFQRPEEMPGVPSLALLGAALLLGIGGLLVRRRPDRPLSAKAILVVVLALATPVGIFLYSVAFSDLFVFSRNLLASLPFAALAFGWLLLRLPRLAAGAALALAGVGLAIGTAETLSEAQARPNFPELADYIDGAAGPRDVVVYQGDRDLAVTAWYPLQLYFDRPHPTAFEPDPRAWARQLRSRRLIVVAWWGIGWSPRPLPPARALTRIDERAFPGIQPLAAAVYRSDPLRGPDSYSVSGGRLIPAEGPSLPIRRSGVVGVIGPVKAAPPDAYHYNGWAHHRTGPVDKIVVLAGRSVVYADAPSLARPDVAGAPNEGQALGFELRVPLRLLRDSGRLTAYALWNGGAYRLSYLCPAGRPQPIPCPADAIRP
jgi:4-amino-4-deoxy-L-arabinose transferase-like glycosyltransferase